MSWHGALPSVSTCVAFASDGPRTSGWLCSFNIVRAQEFRHLNVMWDHDAYGSIGVMILGLHTTHIVTDFL